MSRVRYLAALAGLAERRPAPPLRPPRRLFPHELPPVEPLPEPQPAGETGGKPATEEQSAVGSEPVAPEPVGEKPVDVVAPVRARRPDAPARPPARAPRVQDGVRPPVVDTPSAPRREVEVSLEPPAAATALRAPEPTPPARREERTERKPVDRDSAKPARAPAPRRSVTTIEPSLSHSRAAAPPERAATKTRGLHIGSIDVTVTPPAAAPREPALAAPPTPAPRSPATFDPRGASMSRWFGLAQR